MSALLRPNAAPHRPPTERARPPLRVLGQPERTPPKARRGRRFLPLMIWGVLFVAVLGANVAVQARTTQGQFELDDLQRASRQRRADYQRLRLRVAELEAPQRIVSRAAEMGMVEAGPVTYLVPTATTSAGLPTSETTGEGEPVLDEAAQGWSRVKPLLDGRP